MTTRSITRRSLLHTGAAGSAALVLGGPHAARAQAAEIKVALIAPLSGPWARQGELMRKGADVAIKHVNDAGGIKAIGGARLKLLTFDTGENAEKAKNAAQRMVSQEPDLVGGTGSWLSSFTLAVTEVTERADLPMLTLSYADQITTRGFKYVFQTSPTGGTQSQTALPTLVAIAEKATGKKAATAGIIQDNTAAPISFAKPMREGGLEKLGIKLTVDEIFTPPLADATPMIQKLRSARPDFLLLLPTAIPDVKLLLEKINEMGLGKGRVPLIANGSYIGTPELAKNVGADLLEGVMFIVANWRIKGQDAMEASFAKETGEAWITQDSISTYGDIWILKEALEKAGKADRKAVAEAIRAMDTTDGPAKYFPGGRVKFLENGRRADAAFVIVQWQNGKPLTVWPEASAVATMNWPKA
jgi:branched-chain amino acid transport system substrate-binding protein